MMRRTVHSVIEIPIAEGAKGSSIPILILENGEISLLCLAWARDLMISEENSPPALYQAIQGVGLFYDFYVLCQNRLPLSAENVSWMLSRFLEARQHGNEFLHWRPVRRKTARNDVVRISSFSLFCAKNFNHLPINPPEKTLIKEMSFQDRATHHQILAMREKWDPLSHLIPATSMGQGIVYASPLKIRNRSPSRTNMYDYFPPEKVWALINATPSTRDKLFFLLMFFGATRESEPLHLYVTDVKVMSNGNARVVLADPIEAPYNWDDTFLGKRHGTRSFFLNERYRLAPRNNLGMTDPLRSGWKGMEYSAPKRKESEIEWLIPGVDKLFAHFHKRYMKTTRRYVEDTHPYYFVNEKEGANFGKPVKLSNMIKAFYRAAKRIGLEPSDQGVNPHGARHFFGHFCASYLRLPIETTKIMMRHVNLQSTEVYYSLSMAVVREDLKKAHTRISEELPNFCAEAQKALKKESSHDD